jgi:hypothetical protein
MGDQVLAPGPTDYTQGVKYNTFDVTRLLRPGTHAIGLVLGNSNFNEGLQCWPIFLAQEGAPYGVPSSTPSKQTKTQYFGGPRSEFSRH